MDNAVFAAALFGCLCLAGGAALALYAARLLRKLDRMLDHALSGTFHASHWDEGRLSRLEAKLARQLSAGDLARRRVDGDRQRLQALVGDLSHQPKTPLANISLYTQLLEEQALTPPAREMAAQIAAQSGKLDFLIHALLKLSRLESGMVRTHPAAHPLAGLLDAAGRAWGARAAAKGLRFHVAPTGASARFDPKWTREALDNLIDNAVKYTPPGGRVTVSARAYELFARIDVADDGPGVPESEQAAVFGRFFRGTAAREAEGVGVGLYLAREIAAQQGGYLKLAPAPGGGSVFSLFLPREM